MISFGFSIDLQDEVTAQKYKAYHQAVWPEVETALQAIGVHKMRIFYQKPLRLFMYVEAIDGFDPTKDFDKAEAMDPKVKEWCAIMNKELLKRANPEEGNLVWFLMDDIYNFEK
jgi:L-rhamnose mutarotase